MLQVATKVDGRPALCGELDLAVVPALETFLASLDGNAEIDVSGVTFFDSTALRTFLAIRRRNVHLRLVNPSEAVVKVLQITGTLDYLLYGREINWFGRTGGDDPSAPRYHPVGRLDEGTYLETGVGEHFG